MMITNVGLIDRIARVVVGAVLITWAMGYIGPMTTWNWMGWIGVVPLLTGVLGTCPMYSMLGVTTCRASAV